MNRIYLYGIAGASDKYAVIRYAAVDVDYRPIDAIKMEADIMRMDYPSVKQVFAIASIGRSWERLPACNQAEFDSGLYRIQGYSGTDGNRN